MNFLVCGPESSGNRVMAAILVRAGLAGEGSTNQPDLSTFEKGEQSWVVIHHFRHTREWLLRLQPVKMLIMVREAHACAMSAVKRGHSDDYEGVLRRITAVVCANLVDAHCMGIEAEIIPYEALVLPGMVEKFLSRHGLRADNTHEPLQLIGQDSPSYPVVMNDYQAVLRRDPQGSGRDHLADQAEQGHRGDPGPQDGQDPARTVEVGTVTHRCCGADGEVPQCP